MVSPSSSPIYTWFRLSKAFYRCCLKDIEESILAIVDLGFAFFWFWFFFLREDYKRSLFFVGNCLVLLSISISLSFLDRQGEEKRGEKVEEDSSSLNYIYIWFSDIGGFLGPPGSNIL